LEFQKQGTDGKEGGEVGIRKKKERRLGDQRVGKYESKSMRVNEKVEHGKKGRLGLGKVKKVGRGEKTLVEGTRRMKVLEGEESCQGGCEKKKWRHTLRG